MGTKGTWAQFRYRHAQSLLSARTRRTCLSGQCAYPRFTFAGLRNLYFVLFVLLQGNVATNYCAFREDHAVPTASLFDQLVVGLSSVFTLPYTQFSRAGSKTFKVPCRDTHCHRPGRPQDYLPYWI